MCHWFLSVPGDYITKMFRQRKNVKIYKHAAVIATLTVIYTVSCITPALAQSEFPHEYKIKAAFIFNLIRFIEDWKFEHDVGKDNRNDKNRNKPIVVGIIGEDPFRDAFEPLKDRQVKDRKVSIKYFKGFSDLKKQDEEITLHPDIKDIKMCDLIFVCSSEEQYINNILSPIRNESVLTLVDTQSFLEKGIIINFIIEKNKDYFEVNANAAKRANLTIRSKLLRLAKRVIEKDAGEEK